MPKRNTLILAVVVLVSTSMSTGQPLTLSSAPSQQDVCQKFSETSRAVCGKFLKFWRDNGTVRIFGYPITNEFTEFVTVNGRLVPYTVQYFERAVFELSIPGDGVQLRRVGAELLDVKFPHGNEAATLPLYPSAKILGVDLGATLLTRVTTFQTTDSPSSIFTFYEDFLRARGWRVGLETPNTLYLDKDLPLGDRYSVYVEVTQASQFETRAKLYFTYSPIM